MANKSDLTLEIRLPVVAGDSIDFQTATGATWSRQPGPISSDLRADMLWQRLEQRERSRRDVLNEAGLALSEWLFDQRAVQYLVEAAKIWNDGRPKLRLELRVSRMLVEWAWETLIVGGLGPLAVHHAFTLVRVSDQGEQTQIPTSSQLSIEMIGVQLPSSPGWEELATGEEVERIRNDIEAAGCRGRFSVRVDLLGDWESLVHRYEEHGPPHVFHFAGHGIAEGRGLVFRGANGKPEEIPADVIASLLSRRKHGRQARLAFLNACSTAAGKSGPLQPFGGLAQILIQHYIPAVVGFQTPVEDHSAQRMAISFYSAISRGDSVDCALQSARESVYYLGGRTVAWAFANITVSGNPQPLWLPTDSEAAHHPSADILDFGHEDQRHRLQRFLKRPHPLVILISGEMRSGHRHVALRVQHDLEKVGNVLWRPVATMRWFVAGEPLLSRSQLTGGIARSLNLPDAGYSEDLEERIAREISLRCAEGRVLVIDLEEVLTPRDEAHADALVSLVQNLWADLMEIAASYQSRLPVFLILSVAYPKLVRVRNSVSRLMRKQRELTERAIESIAREIRLRGRVRVEVLPPLQPIDVNYVAGFLEEVLDLDSSRAESMASDVVGVGLDDNDTILERMARLLAEWEEV